MNSSPLNNLVKTGQLKAEPRHLAELQGLIHSGQTRLKDANNTSLSAESRFDLAYNAAHSLALAALRFHGYRSMGTPTLHLYANDFVTTSYTSSDNLPDFWIFSSACFIIWPCF